MKLIIICLFPLLVVNFSYETDDMDRIDNGIGVGR